MTGKIFSTCLLLIFFSSAWADDPKFFKFYMKVEKAISRCADIRCYRKVMVKYGSEDIRKKLANSADTFIQKTFEIEKKKAKKRIKKGQYYVVEKIIEEDKARLRIASKTYSVLNETIYFVKEEENWKFGKGGEKKKEGDQESKESNNGKGVTSIRD